MKHGNQKYNLEPLKIIGGSTIAETANIYSLKERIRNATGASAKQFNFEDLGNNNYRVTRVA